MKIPLVGPSYQDRSLPLDAQRTINLYPVMDESQQGVVALQGTPGLLINATCGSGPVRGAFNAANGRAFFISGSSLYEVDSSGTATNRGSLLTTGGNVSIDENSTQMMICDQQYGYIFTYATNAFARITDADFPSAGSVTFIDGYFAVNKNSSGSFYISSANDGTTWAALDFATAESSPDDLVRVYNAVGQLWLFGVKTTEIWTNTGRSSFPFQRISGAKMEVGCIAAHSVVSLDNSVFWLGRDNKGYGIVYRADGFSPKRISTFAIENILQQAGDLSSLKAYTYQQSGHSFYVLTGGSLTTTLVYDVSTGLWHERAYLNVNGVYEQHLGSCCIYAFNKHLVGDRQSGNVYQMSLDYYDDNGSAIKRQRTFTHVSDDSNPMKASSLQIDFEAGVGLQTGQGSNPLVWLEVSEDFSKTWSPEYYASIGAVGKYLTRAIWRRLGFAYQFTFRVSISDPVKVSLKAAYLL